MFKYFSQNPATEPRPQPAPSQSPYLGSPIPSRPETPTGSTSSGYSVQRPLDRPHSPAEAAEVLQHLKNKSAEELRKLLSDKDAYNQFLYSLDQVRIQNNIRDELEKQTVQLAKDNLEKESRLTELTNQCRIIRTTELASAQEKLSELEKQKDTILASYSTVSLLRKLHDAMNKAEEESENLHQQLLKQEIDITAFVQKYKKSRITYHQRALLHLAAKTSPSL